MKVDKIILDIDGKKIELSTEQARQLQRLLNNLLGSTAPAITPVIIEYPPYPTWSRWQITWCGDTSIMYSTTSVNLHSSAGKPDNPSYPFPDLGEQ